MVGVVCLLWLDVGGSGSELVGAVLILCATVLYAAGALIIKHGFAGVSPLGLTTAGLALAAVLLAPAAAFTVPDAPPDEQSLGAIVVLGVVCTGLGFLLYAMLIVEAGASSASVITYVNPAVAVLLGVVFLGEDVGAGAVAGMLLILAGSWLSTGGTPPGLRRAPARRRRAAATAT